MCFRSKAIFYPFTIITSSLPSASFKWTLTSSELRVSELAPHVIRLYRQLSVPPVYERHKLDGGGPSVIHYLIYGRPCSTPGIDHIIHEDNLLILDRERDFRFFNLGPFRLLSEVVSVERYIERPERGLYPLDLLDLPRDPLGYINAPGPDPDDSQIPCAVVPFEYLVYYSRG